MNDKIIKKLFKLANKSLNNNEFPVAAIIFDGSKIISYGYNKRNKSNITTDHAEIIAIKKANKKLKSWRLENICMVVTLEPCDMCKSVIKESRLNKVYYIVPRYNFKKQYRCTQFEYYNTTCSMKEKYIYNIKNFFSNKR